MRKNLLAAYFPDLAAHGDRIRRLPIGRPGTQRGYLICIMPRSGSTFLTHLLRDNLHYGFPDEWFNRDSVESELEKHHISGFNAYLEHLWKSYSSAEGVFGLQISWPQFSFLHEMIPLEGVLGYGFKWFYLVRSNIVRQAISLYIAHQTGVFHRFASDPAVAAADAVDYDEAEISRLVSMLVDQESAFEHLFQARGIEPVRLTFEGVMENKKGTLMLFRDVLGISHDIRTEDTSAVRKLDYAISREFEQRFRASSRTFLDEVSHQRRLPEPGDST